MKLKCMIVDDEPSGRMVIEEYISETGFLEVAGKAENPLKAQLLMEEQAVDLVYLDIQMPKLNGIDFLKTLKNPPLVILTTAFPDYALQGFELDVVDYLLKPISLDRFLRASHKARELFELRNRAVVAGDHFFVKCDSKYEKVLYDDLLYAEGANNYVMLQTKDRLLITYLTFKGILEALPADQFMKVHKSFIVSLSKIENLDGEQIKIDKHNIPISRGMKEEVMERVVNRRLVKR